MTSPFVPERNCRPLPIEKGFSRSDAQRNSMTLGARRVGASEKCKSRARHLRWASGHHEIWSLSRCQKTFQRQVSGKVLSKFRNLFGGNEMLAKKFLELPHFRRAQLIICPLQILKCWIELFQPVSISPPVKWLMPDNVLKGLCYHRPLHRVKIIGNGQG